MTQHIEHAVQNGVIRVRINRPKRCNALDREMVCMLTEVFRDAGSHADHRALVLESTGRVFCAGVDLNWMRDAQHLSLQENQEDAELVGQMIYALEQVPVPKVACVQGSAYGGGLGFLACCDWVVSVQAASFSMPEIRWGLLPAILAPFMVRAVGLRRTQYALLSAASFSAEEARAYGLVHEVLEDRAAFESRCEAIIMHLENASLPAQQAYKRLVALAAERIGPDTLLAGASLLAELRVTPEAQSRLGAFIDKKLNASHQESPNDP